MAKRGQYSAIQKKQIGTVKIVQCGGRALLVEPLQRYLRVEGDDHPAGGIDVV